MYVLSTERMELAYAALTGDGSQHKGPLYIHTLVSHLFHLVRPRDSISNIPSDIPSTLSTCTRSSATSSTWCVPGTVFRIFP
eukprot:3142231-Pyramimonas_sp.AAC.1